ncbi:hypothetical protein BJ322DRAFT_853518 [Thelephora terrestris]|uniref:F-box domain-containing protein n=1 Tax=Thelephora terrestris TaxID=56493 RepID=A0A9P6HCV5_9AGAM|nr:hypothetical protein BJ322DRAFT_853518 [Thelephora terrestris]
MSLEAARDLSIPDLLRVLNEKLSLECTKIQVFPVVSADSLEFEIANLEARAHNVLKLIPSLRIILQNLLQPVNRLPPDIISRIARAVPHKYSNFDAQRIIPLTHVCRYWRASIVSTPENWTLVSSCSKLLAALSLERSASSPLEVSLFMDEVKERPGVTDLLIPYLRSVETLRISELTTTEEIARTLPNFPHSMPNLRSLELSLSDEGDNWDPSFDPFGLFPHTLSDLSLHDVPLYPSFLNIRALTQFTFFNQKSTLPMDTLLTFLEENRALESVTIMYHFPEIESPPRRPQHRTVVGDRLRFLRIQCWSAVADAKFLISSITLGKGAHLEISSGCGVGFNEILSGVSTTHLENLPGPTFMEYESHPREIRLRGPNGSFSFNSFDGLEGLFIELPALPPLTHIREFRLVHRTLLLPPPGPELSYQLSSFPALETLAIECDVECNTDLSGALSPLLSKASAHPSLKTLAFLNCVITDEFVEGLTRFASNREKTASARLYRVVIVHRDGRFPSAGLIRALKRRVPVVDVRFGKELPTDLT